MLCDPIKSHENHNIRLCSKARQTFHPKSIVLSLVSSGLLSHDVGTTSFFDTVDAKCVAKRKYVVSDGVESIEEGHGFHFVGPQSRGN
jgi:hypothetical protein